MSQQVFTGTAAQAAGFARLTDLGAVTVTNVTSATYTIPSNFNGSVYTLNKDGLVITLPAATQAMVGNTFTLIIGTSQTSTNTITITGNSASGTGKEGYSANGKVSIVTFTGTSAALNGASFAPDGTSNYILTLTATTKGGLAGGQLTFTCVAPGTNDSGATSAFTACWMVTGMLTGSGTVITPFS